MPPRKPGHLFPKEAAFVQQVPFASSLTQAAINAGYSPNSARAIGPENMKKPAIQDALAAQQAATISANVMSLLERKERLSALAIPDPEHPDPVRAIDVLNRMEQVYIERSQIDQRIEIVVHGFFGEGVPLPDTQPMTPVALEASKQAEGHS